MSTKARTVFLGTGTFAVPIVAALSEQPGIDLAAIVTVPQRIGSRGRPTDPPVATWASEHGLTMLRPSRLRAADALDEIAGLRPELLVLADYGQIVPASLLELPSHGALNLHPSLLPLHRGATPISTAILDGDAATGVTLMRMDAGLDTGPIVAQSRIELSGRETAPELEQSLAILAARLLMTSLPRWLDGEIEPRPQDEGSATVTRPLRREDGRIDPSRSAMELERQVRAYQPWPGSFLDTAAGRMVTWSSHIAESRPSNVPVGTIVRGADGGLALAASDAILTLDEVQPAGGRRMSSAELVRGRPGLVGSTAR